MSQKNLYFIATVVITLLMGGVFGYWHMNKYANLENIKKNDLSFSVDSYSDQEVAEFGGGVFEMTLHFRSTDGKPIHPHDIHFYVDNGEGVSEVLYAVTYDDNKYLYIAKTGLMESGQYTLSASVDGGRFHFEKEGDVPDLSFVKEIDLEPGDITFEKNFFNVGKIEKLEPYYYNDEDMGWWSMTRPGKITFDLMSSLETPSWAKATLEIYPVHFSFLEKFLQVYSGDQYFVKHLRELESLLEHDQSYIERRSFFSIANFPPVNASPAGVSRKALLQTSQSNGIRLTVAGYKQAVSPAEQPLYIYQGLTNDKNYLIVFRFERLHSQELAQVLAEGESRGVDNEWFFHTMDVEEKVSDLTPSLATLDRFVESIQITGREKD